MLLTGSSLPYCGWALLLQQFWQVFFSNANRVAYSSRCNASSRSWKTREGVVVISLIHTTILLLHPRLPDVRRRSAGGVGSVRRGRGPTRPDRRRSLPVAYPTRTVHSVVLVAVTGRPASRTGNVWHLGINWKNGRERRLTSLHRWTFSFSYFPSSYLPLVGLQGLIRSCFELDEFLLRRCGINGGYPPPAAAAAAPPPSFGGCLPLISSCWNCGWMMMLSSISIIEVSRLLLVVVCPVPDCGGATVVVDKPLFAFSLL